MKYDLTFTNASDQRGMLAVHGPRCVAEWHAAKVLRQRVARAITIAPSSPPRARAAATDCADCKVKRLVRRKTRKERKKWLIH